MLVNIGIEDEYALGVLSSKIHVTWAMAAGGKLGVGNDSRYNTSRCFQTFPFPDATETQKDQVRILASQLDEHRKSRQELHPSLTMTDMYNVMEKLRTGEKLSPKDQMVHEQGLVSLLFQLHTELDAAVAQAYGWSADLSEQEILEKLVELNKVRAAEEESGLIRWLRPEFQNPKATQQTGLTLSTSKAKVSDTTLPEWPKSLADQARAVQQMLQSHQHPVSALVLNRQFKKVPKPANDKREKEIGNLLETISQLGLLRKTEEGLYVR
jgi:hypothetical protein